MRNTGQLGLVQDVVPGTKKRREERRKGIGIYGEDGDKKAVRWRKVSGSDMPLLICFHKGKHGVESGHSLEKGEWGVAVFATWGQKRKIARAGPVKKEKRRPSREHENVRKIGGDRRRRPCNSPVLNSGYGKRIYRLQGKGKNESGDGASSES